MIKLEDLLIDNVILEFSSIDERLLELPRLHLLPQFSNRVLWEDTKGIVCIKIATYDVHPVEVLKILQDFDMKCYTLTAKRCDSYTYVLDKEDNTLTVERCDSITLTICDQKLPYTVRELEETMINYYSRYTMLTEIKIKEIIIDLNNDQILTNLQLIDSIKQVDSMVYVSRLSLSVVDADPLEIMDKFFNATVYAYVVTAKSDGKVITRKVKPRKEDKLPKTMEELEIQIINRGCNVY